MPFAFLGSAPLPWGWHHPSPSPPQTTRSVEKDLLFLNSPRGVTEWCHEILMHFSQWDHVRAPQISVTLRLTIPGILFLTHAFRQPQPHNLTFPLTCCFSNPIIFNPGRLPDQGQDLPLRLLWHLSERRWRDKEIRLWRTKRARLQSKNFLWWKHDKPWIIFLRQNFAKGAARHYLSSEGKEQRGLLYVHRQSRHFSPSCWGLSDQLSSTSMISYDFGRIVVVVIVGVALHVRESKLPRWSNAWTKAPNVWPTPTLLPAEQLSVARSLRLTGKHHYHDVDYNSDDII